MNRNQSHIQVLPGSNGIKDAYELSLRAKNLDIVCLSSAYASVIGDYFDKEYAPLLFGSATKTREILPDTEANRKDSQKKDGRKNQVRFLAKSIPSESDFLVFEHTAILVSYNLENPFAVVITDRDIVANLKNQFDRLWEFLR
ncbi:hypothetical protein KKG44_02145 [Patescibacteria group bacterium]|nr:hypothetical protein [Patescibacteria group bacterium]MBU2544736.1 hypothetical protein [Patescibacteria group bacterium]